ncbi:MAG: hypothetical protein KAJ73_10205, partial [Zetaproteobacteria bacterium]|nr:hypothetical protein [Zetaproteobacteria bacterium]
PDDTSVTNQDDDTAGITVAESEGATNISESGLTDTYTMVLNTRPTTDVTATITPDIQSTVSPGTLTFTSLNWDIVQTITVTAVDDSVVEGNHNSTIFHIAESEDSHYDGAEINSIIVNVNASIADNDIAVTPPPVVVASSGGGGGGGGGSSIDLTTPYKLPATTSSSTVSIYRPVELSLTNGEFVRPVKLYSYYNKKLAAEIPQGTKVTTPRSSFARPIYYTGTAAGYLSPRSIDDQKVYTAVSIGSTTESLHFDQTVKLSIPITLAESVDTSKVNIFYYDPNSSSYKMTGNGGTVSADRRSIATEVNRFGTFAVIESNSTEIKLAGAMHGAAPTTLSDIAGQWFTPFIEKL